MDGQPSAKKLKVAEEGEPAAAAHTTSSSSSLGPARDEVQARCIFVSGLGPNVTKEKLKDFFQSCGRIVTCDMAHRPSGPIAFVEFCKEEQAQKAIKTSGAFIDGLKINVQAKKSPGGAAAKVGKMRSNLVFIKFMDGAVLTASEVTKAFQLCGNIKDVRMHASKDYGFIEFTTCEAAKLAVQVRDPRFQVHYSTTPADQVQGESDATKSAVLEAKNKPATCFRPRTVKRKQ